MLVFILIKACVAEGRPRRRNCRTNQRSRSQKVELIRQPQHPNFSVNVEQIEM